jgi:hypothetical protein
MEDFRLKMENSTAKSSNLKSEGCNLKSHNVNVSSTPPGTRTRNLDLRTVACVQLHFRGWVVGERREFQMEDFRLKI